MSRRRAAAVGLLVASALALGAGVVPSVAQTRTTDALLEASAEIAAGTLALHREEGPVAGLRTGSIDVPDLGGGAHRVRVGVVEPTGDPVADLLFVHGHADRLDNHAALFGELADAGVRVVSFDLPSHGETDAGAIDRWSFDDLGALGAGIARLTQQDPDRPFVLAGWSFGGLLATKFVQDPRIRSAFGRPVAGLALESPAIVPLTFAGGDGVSRLRALTHDLRAPVAGPPSPASPFLDPVFAGRLVAQAMVVSAHPLPSDVPALVVLGGEDDDRYVDVRRVRAWAEGTARDDGADVEVRVCSGGRHGLDIEAWPIGAGARNALVAFTLEAAGVDHTPTTDPREDAACR